jgi:hypothetical protein
VIGVDHKTWIGIWEHTAPASFTVLAMLARIAAVVGVSPHNVTNIPLPDVAPQMVVDDLSKLRTISVRNPWIVQWCDLRLQQIQTTPSADEDTPWFLARAINVGFVQMQAAAERELSPPLFFVVGVHRFLLSPLPLNA